MGNCCSGRVTHKQPTKNDEIPEFLIRNKDSEFIDKGYFSSIASGYISYRQGYTSNQYRISNTNSQKVFKELEQLQFRELNAARETKDLRQIGRLMKSNTPITIEEVTLHPWAEIPKSIGSLACTQLGIFASDKQILESEWFYTEIFDSDILDTLLEHLSSADRDKYEAALLAISFMSEDSKLQTDPQIIDYLLKSQAMEKLIVHLADMKEPTCRTAALCCRNLYLYRPQIQRQFILHDGARHLVNMLSSQDNITVVEAVLNILDLIVDPREHAQSDIKMQLQELHIVNVIDNVLNVGFKQNAKRYEAETVEEVRKLRALFVK